MRELYYPASGAGGSFIGMILGVIDFNGLINAFVFGAVGALGGVIVKLLINWFKKKITKRDEKFFKDI
jgi:uncharacterized membrane protein